MLGSDEEADPGPGPGGPAEGPQLTLRALLAGAALGALLCLSNLFVALKTGWSLGVTLTASAAAWALFAGARRVGLSRVPLAPLENNAACSVASAAGYMSGGGNLAALPALLMLGGPRPSAPAMALWFALLAGLGVLVAVPLRRRLIVVEQLPFPTGAATAEAIRALHAPRAAGRARPLLLAALGGGVTALLRDGPWRWLPLHLPALVAPPIRLGGQPAAGLTLAFEPGLLLVGAGALVGARAGLSMLLAALVQFGAVAPALIERGVIAGASYKAIVAWSVWPAAGLLLASALTALAFDLARFARTLGTDGEERGGGRTAAPTPDGEAPRWWLVAGLAILGPAIVVLAVRLFGVPWYAALASLPLALLMALVAARATGETDVTPTQALGPAVQLGFGALVPGRAVVGLIGANVTAGVGLHAADLLTDLKAGYLLGARPRAQVLAQLAGVLTGAAIIAPAFDRLVPNAALLGTAALPAPSAMVWAGVARLVESGLGALHPSARTAALAAALLGVALAVLERRLPARAARLVPSPAALGVALVMPAWSSLSLCLGALLAAAWRARRPASAALHLAPVASGLIAGESVVGALIALGVALAR